MADQPRNLTKLMSGSLGGVPVFIAVETTPGGGRQYVFNLNGAEVTREVFIVATKLAHAQAAEKAPAQPESVPQAPQAGLEALTGGLERLVAAVERLEAKLDAPREPIKRAPRVAAQPAAPPAPTPAAPAAPKPPAVPSPAAPKPPGA